MFWGGTKALFGKCCLNIGLHLLKQILPEGQKSIFSVHFPAHLSHLWQIIFILVFVIYKLSDNLIQSDKPERPIL